MIIVLVWFLLVSEVCFRAVVELDLVEGAKGDSMVGGRTGVTKLRGAATRPTSSPRLKFSVESVARETPTIRREKHEMRVWCCGVALKTSWSVEAMRRGSSTVSVVMRRKKGSRA